MPRGPGAFGDLLRQLRIAKNLTQEELSELAGMSARSVSDLERGRNRYPYRATVIRLIEVLEPSEAEVEALWSLAARRKGPASEASERRIRLPHPLTAILGREREVMTVLHTLRWEGARLVTLTGPGGVGKTRLAVAVAPEAVSDYADGATFVSLASVSDPSLVPATVVASLQIQQRGTVPSQKLLLSYLRDREHLLILDNFEHVLEAGVFVAELLAHCPKVKALITSRAPLRVRGERQIAVAPLALPALRAVSSEADLIAVPATALFLERARAVRPDLPLNADALDAIPEICRRLDGLPLAIELAAAQARYAHPGALLAQLEPRLDTLTRGDQDLPARQQTLRATIDWSFHLLSPSEQSLFRQLAVFSGGADLEATATLSGRPSTSIRSELHSLHDASLAIVENTSLEGFRVHMLDTIRAYAVELLSGTGEGESLRDAHLAYFLRLAETAEPHLTGREQKVWIARLERERDNLRSAITWAYDRGRSEEGLRLLTALRIEWEAHGPLGEERYWLEKFIAASSDTLQRNKPLHARALMSLARVYWFQAEWDRAHALLQHALSLVDIERNPSAAAPLLNNLANVVGDQGRTEHAVELYHQALTAATRSGDVWTMAAVYTNLGTIAADLGRLDEATTALERGRQLLHELGEQRVIGMNLNLLGELVRMQGMVDRAEATFLDALTALVDVGDRTNAAWSFDCLARVAHDRGDAVRCVVLMSAADRIRRDVGAGFNPAFQASKDAMLTDCEQRLGPARFLAAQEQGAALSFDRAVDLALDHGFSKATMGHARSAQRPDPR